MVHTPTHSRNSFATFYDLPGELRNEIYQTIVQYDKEQYIKLKLKCSSNGRVYVKSPHPPLSHAIPLLRHEILSVYYSINTFQISLKTKQERDTFRAWVTQLGSALAGLKRLNMKVGARISQPKFRYYRRDDLICTLKLTTNTNGEFTVNHNKQSSRWHCVCWFDALVAAGLQQSRSRAVALREQHEQRSSSASSSYAVANLGLRICNILDMAESQAFQEEQREFSGSQSQDIMPKCINCGMRALSYPGRYMNSSILYLRSLGGHPYQTKPSSPGGDQQQAPRRQRRSRNLGAMY